MNINQLKYFVAAAENRSFTKAAEQFYISQTAITLQIKALEDFLGCRLFDRDTRPVSLTPAGNVFLSEAKGIIDRTDSAIARTLDASTGLEGSLRIGYTKGYERSCLSEWLRVFHDAYPNILITCGRKPTDELSDGLLTNEYDIIFTWDSTNLKQAPGIEHRIMENSGLVAALYARHPLARKKTLKRSDLRGENLLYMSPSAAEDSYKDAFFMQLYLKAGCKPNILMRSSDYESILMMVAAEEGISILPGYCTRKLSDTSNLVFVPLTGPDEYAEIIAAWQKDNSNPALEHMKESIIEKNCLREASNGRP